MEFEIIDHEEWHTEEDFPADLTPVHALTHMGMYFEWAAHKQLLHPDLAAQLAPALEKLATRELTGRDIVEQALGKQLLLSFFNDLGQRFSAYYYADDEEGYGQFLSDYVTTLRTDLLPSFYHVDNSQAAYNAIASQFDIAYARWSDSLRDTAS